MAGVGTGAGQGGGKRNGEVQMQEYEREEYVAQLEVILQRLKDATGEKPDRKAWGLFLAGLQQFQEDCLGKAGIEQKMFPKIPAKLFRNFHPEGPIFAMIRKAVEMRDRQGLRRLDFTDPKMRSVNLDMLQAINEVLLRGNFIEPPRVRIMPQCGEAIGQLQEAVRQLKGHLVTDESDENVTHVVYPTPPSEGEEADYLRLLHVRPDSFGLVHWWYLPDSYDEWMHVSQISTTDVQPDPTIDRTWKVHSRWVTDSLQYNEWMNPYDYITQEFERELDQIGALEQGKRKRDDLLQAAADKRPRVVTGEVDPAKAERLTPFVVRQHVVNPVPKSMDGTATVENISQGQQLRVPHIQPRANKPPRPPSQTRVPPGDPNPLRIPVHSHWFNMEAIDEIERRCVPEFFTGKVPSKTPESYKELRNFMVSKYRENVERYLTFTETRKYLSADVSSLHSIWSFLTHWGLINFQATDAPPEATAATPPDTLLGLLASHVQPTKEGLMKLPAGSVQAGVQAAAQGGGLSMAAKKDQYYGKDISGKSGQKVRFYCNAMPWKDCTALRYHCTRYPDIDLCPEAFADGKFPPGCTAKDFIRIEDQSTKADAPGWSEQEELLLLEGLELHGDTWDAVAQHVGTKSTLECLQHFLTMPIEEDLWQEAVGKRSDATARAATGELPAGEDDSDWDDIIPFADASNPVMLQVATLASIISPKVASAAAKAALEEITREDGEAGGPQQASTEAGGEGQGAEARGEWLSRRQMKVAAAKAISAAAVKAKLLALEEEKTMFRLVCNAVLAQLKKVQLKMQNVNQMQEALDRERARLAHWRQKLTEERLTLKEERDRLAQGNAPSTALDAPAAGMPGMMDDELDNIFGYDDDDI